jgi:hypothetical protein
MSEKYKYENGAIHLDHHMELHLSKVNSSDAKDLMREFFESEAEDIDVFEEISDGLAEIQEDMKELKAAKKDAPLANGIDVTPEEQIRLCIFLLMNEHILVKKKGKEVEEPLFNRQNHWQAIYRILVDKKFCKDSDFDGFDLFINKVMPSKVNAPYKKSSVKQISQTDFNKPFAKWKFDAETSGTLRPYERMKAIAQRFLELLEEKGL